MTETRDQDRRYVFHPFSMAQTHEQSGALMMAQSAEGCWITDDSGKRYLDAMAGLWCVNVGYGRDRIADAMADQARKLSYFHGFSSMATEPAAILAERVIEKAPKGFSKVFFGASGSDANDTQAKLVWYYNNARGLPQKKKIIARDRGYHGVTVLSGGLTGLPGLHAGFDLPLPMIRHVSAPHNLWTRLPDEDDAAFSARLAKELDDMIVAEGPDTVAAFIAEPVMGAGGVIVPPQGYFPAIREVLDRHDVLLIADEVICGFGRLGTWFGAQALDMTPDMMSIAKGITSGYAPLSGVLVGDKVWQVIAGEAAAKYGAFGHGYTYTAHPVMAAAALANLDIVEEDNLVDRAGRMGDYLNQALAKAFDDLPIVAEVRGKGLMAAVEFARPSREGWQKFDPALQVGPRIIRAALQDGVISRALPNGDAISFSPPFTVTPEEIDLAVSTVRKAAQSVCDALRAEDALAPL
ncbi:aminotransferase [Mameliella sediminis]|uniref:aminotransferase n=1 Tax=Mameliella sediminis TaxID=2836866 RepID=UPI001C4444DD|nr:aminotransferase [Mameliella sediminis]MBV7397302.1 aminotransferase class III-fold pyridoxal phosphate-dependent enzyme [Mameliella sediminis]MBY6146921.1 aminotransferase class III-fold pyridoxal phosphate-dependent enzyme [Mameliella alba]MCA0956716.1 aminotransferase class III-fold pyridoxal phosphate-dependent enzyme [Mameliella alba]